MRGNMKKTALITGACINTGVAIVEKFASEGYNVIFTGRNAEKVRASEKEYKAKFPNVEIVGYPVDSLIDARTVDEASVKNMFADIDSRGLFVETLVLNAADQGLGQKIFENPLTDLMKVINTNVVWNYCLSEHAAKRMKENGGGNIVFVNSNTAYRAIPDRIAYSTSKGGQLGMMRAMALDLGKYNIRVNAVLPGMIRTNRWNEFIELAMWHDSLMENIEQYVNMDEETFHRIELKAAYTQCIMLSHIAENLTELKAKASKNRIINNNIKTNNYGREDYRSN